MAIESTENRLPTSAALFRVSELQGIGQPIHDRLQLWRRRSRLLLRRHLAEVQLIEDVLSFGLEFAASDRLSFGTRMTFNVMPGDILGETFFFSWQRAQLKLRF